MTRLNVDQINILLMLLSVGVAYFLPFELVLFSYAILGPAHYLTQISWLHDREYYVGGKWLWAPFAILCGAMLIVAYTHSPYALIVSYAAMSIALGLSMALVISKQRRYRAVSAVILLLCFAMLFLFSLDFVLAMVVLLPTVIHVFVFTGFFILLGALKSNSFWGMISFFVFLFCGTILFIVIPQENIISITYLNQGMPFFEDVVSYLRKILSFNGNVEELSVLGFISFAYTYHYLNWFSKTEVLKWHQIPKRRAKIIAVLYVLSIAIYLYDYKIGFMTLALLSLMHVVLEFPLDVIAIKSIPGLLRQKLMKRA